MRQLMNISQEKVAFNPVEVASGLSELGRRTGVWAKRLSGGSGIAKGLRSAASNVKSVGRMAEAGGEVGEEALRIAKKTHGNLAEINRELLSKDVSGWNVAGRISKSRRLKKTQKLMEKNQQIMTPPPPGKKPVIPKKSLLLGGGLIGTGMLGASYIGSKGKDANSKYSRYYQ